MSLGEPVDVSEAQDGGIMKVQFPKNNNLLTKYTYTIKTTTDFYSQIWNFEKNSRILQPIGELEGIENQWTDVK